jgi:hypothetical protein
MSKGKPEVAPRILAAAKAIARVDHAKDWDEITDWFVLLNDAERRLYCEMATAAFAVAERP